DLVGRSLARPSEITVELEIQLSLGHVQILFQELVTVLGIPRTGAPLLGNFQPQMDSDVEDHAGGANALGIKHAHVISRVIEITQLVHESFRIERPAFAVAGNPAHQATPAVERSGLHLRSTDLQVVSWNAFVVDRGQLCPSGELILARGNGPPHAARTAEV